MVLFWHRHWEGAWNKLTTATLSWLSFIPNMLSHLALLSQSLGNWWKEVPGLVTYVLAYCIILDRTSTDSHSSHTVINVQVSCLSLWLLKFCNQYSCSHARVSNHPPANFAIHYNTLCTAKEQPDVTSDIPCIPSFVCNWSIDFHGCLPWRYTGRIYAQFCHCLHNIDTHNGLITEALVCKGLNCNDKSCVASY